MGLSKPLSASVTLHPMPFTYSAPSNILLLGRQCFYIPLSIRYSDSSHPKASRADLSNFLLVATKSFLSLPCLAPWGEVPMR